MLFKLAFPFLFRCIRDVHEGVENLLKYIKSVKGLALIRDAVYDLLANSRLFNPKVRILFLRRFCIRCPREKYEDLVGSLTLKGQGHVTVNKSAISRIYIVSHTWPLCSLQILVDRGESTLKLLLKIHQYLCNRRLFLYGVQESIFKITLSF